MVPSIVVKRSIPFQDLAVPQNQNFPFPIRAKSILLIVGETAAMNRPPRRSGRLDFTSSLYQLSSLNLDHGLRRFFSDDLFNQRLLVSKSLFYRNMKAHYGCVNAVEFCSKDESLFASGGDDKRVLVWNVSECISRIAPVKPCIMKAEHDSNIFCLAFDGDNEKLLSSGNDHQLIAHDIQTGDAVDVFRDEDAVYCISTHPESKNLFATASEEGSVKVFDLRAPASTDPFVLVSGRAAFHSVMYNPVEPQLFATANVKDGVQLFDIRKPQRQILKYTDPSDSQSAMCVRWDALGRHLLALRRRTLMILYKLENSKPYLQFDHPGYYNSCTMKTCCFAGPNDEYVVSGSDNFIVYLWRIPSHTEVSGKYVKQASLTLRGHRSIVNQVRYSKVHQLLASSGVEKVIKLWSPWPLPGSKGGLEEVTDLPRPIYTHGEYINMVMSTDSPLLSHNASTESVEEDPRMIAFFDSLIQRELDGFSDSDSSSDSDEDNCFYGLLKSHPRASELLSNEVVDSESSSDSSTLSSLDEFNVELDVDDSSNSSVDNDVIHLNGDGEELNRFSPFSMAYARYLVARQPNVQESSAASEPDISVLPSTSDTASNEAASNSSTNATSTSSATTSAVPSGLGYLPSPGAERDIVQLVLRKRRLLENKRNRAPHDRKRKRMHREKSWPPSNHRQRITDSGDELSLDEVQRRVIEAHRRPLRQQQMMRRIHARAMLDSDDEADSPRTARADASAVTAAPLRSDPVRAATVLDEINSLTQTSTSVMMTNNGHTLASQLNERNAVTATSSQAPAVSRCMTTDSVLGPTNAFHNDDSLTATAAQVITGTHATEDVVGSNGCSKVSPSNSRNSASHILIVDLLSTSSSTITQPDDSAAVPFAKPSSTFRRNYRRTTDT